MRDSKYQEMCADPEQYDKVIDFVKKNDPSVFSGTDNSGINDAHAADIVNTCIDWAMSHGHGAMGICTAIKVNIPIRDKVRLYIRSDEALFSAIAVKESPSVRLSFHPGSNKNGVLIGTLNFWNTEAGDHICKVSVQKGLISFTPINEGGVLPHFMGDEKINKMANDMVRVYFDSQTNGSAYLWCK